MHVEKNVMMSTQIYIVLIYDTICNYKWKKKTPKPTHPTARESPLLNIDYTSLHSINGKALDWASTVWDSDMQVQTLFEYFAKQIREVFEYRAGGLDVHLLHLRQEKQSAAEYAVHFRMLATQSEWDDRALKFSVTS